MPLTLTGFVALLAALFFVARRGISYSILHPFPHVCLQYLLFFGGFASDETLKYKVDAACLIAFGSFSIALFFGQSLVNGKSAKAYLVGPRPASASLNEFTRLSKGQLMLMFGFIVLVAVFYITFFSEAYGGLSASMVRFYQGQVSETLMSTWFRWGERLRPLCFSLCLCCIGIFRTQSLLQRTRLTSSFYMVSLVLYLLLVTPIGSSGMVLACGMMVLFADVAFSVKTGRRAIRLDTVFLLGLVIAVGGILQSVRGVRFSDPVEVYDYLVHNPDEVVGGSAGHLHDSHASIPDWTALCLERFGGSSGFLWFYTPYSIAVSLVPREFWPAKPVGFGKILADPNLDPEEASASAANPVGTSFAAGLAGEGYANGGYIGIVMLSLLLGLGCGVASKYAVVGLLSGTPIGFAVGLCCRQIPPLFVRGDMLSAFGGAALPLGSLLVLVWCYRQLQSTAQHSTRMGRGAGIRV